MGRLFSASCAEKAVGASALDNLLNQPSQIAGTSNKSAVTSTLVTYTTSPNSDRKQLKKTSPDMSAAGVFC